MNIWHHSGLIDVTTNQNSLKMTKNGLKFGQKWQFTIPKSQLILNPGIGIWNESRDPGIGFRDCKPYIWSQFYTYFSQLKCTVSDGSNTILSNIERTRTSFFEHRTDMNVFIIWESNFERTSNEHRTFQHIWEAKLFHFLSTSQILRWY